MPSEQTELLQRILSETQAANAVEQHRAQAADREKALEPYRDRLRAAEAQAKRSGQHADIEAFSRAKRELRAAERNYTAPAAPESDSERLVRLRAELRQLHDEEARTFEQWQQRPHSRDLPAHYRTVRSKRANLEAQIADLEALIRERG